MPTKTEFEIAADKFDSAAAQIGELAASAESAGALQIIRGGSLGRQVPERIASSAATARACGGQVEQAAQTCRERAAIIGDYEIRLDIYQTAYAYYSRAVWNWSAQHTAWSLDETGLISDPGPQPRPPNPPSTPPEWAEVVRP